MPRVMTSCSILENQIFVQRPLNQIGNAPRNPVYGPARASLDFSLFKDFRLTERLKLQFRAEAFNITNTPNFEVPGNQLGTVAFGVVSGRRTPFPETSSSR